MEEMRKVMIHDEDHIWLDGDKQFISLNRFLKLKNDTNQEYRLLMDRIEQLSKENEAMKTLLNIK